VSLRHGVGLDLPPLEEGRAGDPGLFGPESEAWRIGRERVLLLGGPAALLLQLAHPLVAAGVARHSDFRKDPFERLRATLDATLRISFGDRDQVEEAAARVEATHRRVQGTLATAVGPFPAGTPYAASDPELAMWVFATLVSVAIQMHQGFVGHLPRSRRIRYYEEAKGFAGLFSVTADVLPATYEDFREYVGAVEESGVLVVGEQARGLAQNVLTPPLPTVFRLTGPAARAITASLLPQRLRENFGLRWGRSERALEWTVRTGVRATIAAWPRSVRYWEHYLAACRRVRRSRPGE
jgi:uncharacterized protein (DUF2236 family)